MSNYNNTLSSTALFLLAIGLALAAFFIERVNDHRHAEVIRHSVQDRLEIVESRLESNLISDMQLVKALVAVVAADPNLDQKRFTRAMKTLFEGHSRLKNISAAPDLIIRMMYPIEGNELAIGLDYRTLPNQYPAVALAQRTRKIILNGPIKLIQGGCGFIARIPIYLDTETAKEVFWGLSSIVIRCEQLYEDSGLLNNDLELEIAIRARNGDGMLDAVFFGSTEVFETAPVLTEVSLPYGAWQLAAIPHGGWPQHAENLWTLRIILLIVGALVFFPVWGLLRALHRANAAQESLVNALSLTEATLEATDNGILVINTQGQVVSFNQRFVEMWRIPDLLLDNKDDQLFLAHVLEQLESPQQFLEKVQTLYAQPELISHDTLTFIDGRIFARFSHPQRIGTTIVGRVWSFLDITEQDRAERSVKELTWMVTEALDRSERQRRQLESLIAAIPDPVWMKDSNGVFLSCNAEFSKMMGASITEVIGKTDADFFPPEVAAQFRADDQIAAESATPILCEEWITYRSDGHRALWATVKTPVWSTDGHKLLGVLGIARDITERQTLLAELKQAHQAALAASDAKSKFLSTMSHELRTPLNIIIGFAQMLDLGAPNSLSLQQREAVNHILNSGHHLLNLINEVLDLARIESGLLDLHLENVAFLPLLDEVIGLSHPAAAARQITIYRDDVSQELWLQANERRLKQVLLNLLSNAVKYNRDGGQIKIDCAYQGNQARISIADTGVGIPLEHHTEVFQPFHRFSAEQSIIEGTGIGLSICKSLIDAMGGKIGFESTVNQGSCFWIELFKSEQLTPEINSVALNT
ncbi:ATP-binding protein [Chromatium okenii]|uniref:sensor histidine kinase n=1 Tax=Chromatium okenii TaxID=61644 RepID=UPI0026EAB74D|nr:ATP-binding protein [Chromatium okenii]MBV5310639.1 PAS domain-containing protein [Chromatium okenii]